MMEFRLYANDGRLVYVGYNWEYTRRYLDYLVRTTPDPLCLKIRSVFSREVLP